MGGADEDPKRSWFNGRRLRQKEDFGILIDMQEVFGRETPMHGHRAETQEREK